MNKLIILLFLSLIIPTKIFSQRYTKGQFTMFSYYVNVDEKFKAEISPFESYFKINTGKKQEKSIAILVHNLYELTTQLLSDSLSISILPPNSLADKVKYSDYGYPDISIQKAQRLADSKYFLKILAYFENNPLDEKGSKLPENNFRLQCRINIDLYNAQGIIPMKAASGIYTLRTPIKITTEFFDDLNFVEIPDKTKSDRETLKEIMILAIDDAIYQIKHKK